jgi:hypothetical protein
MNPIEKLQKKQQSNLAKTAIYLLEKVPDSKFSMEYYANDDCGIDFDPHEIKKAYNECGTSCCFAGHGPMALTRSVGKCDRWDEYVFKTYGVNEGDDEWEFLFGPVWDDNRLQAAARALYYLTSGVPEYFNSSDKYYISFTFEEIIEKLHAFV